MPFTSVPLPARPVRRAPRRARLGLLLAAVASTVVVAAPAAAAPYDILQCNDGSGHAVELTPGFVVASSVVNPVDRCGTGGRLELSLGPGNQLSPFGAEFQQMGISILVPEGMANTRITKARANLYVAPKDGDTTLSYGAFTIHGETGVLLNEPVPAGKWSGLPSIDKEAAAPGAGSKFMRFLVTCYGPCDFQATPAMTVGRMVVTLDDAAPPAAARLEPDGLLSGGPQAGTRTVRYSVSDADSGVHRVELRTSAGTLLTSSAVGLGCSYTRPIPCPQSRTGSLDLDTTKLPDGAQALELWTIDAGGTIGKTALSAVTVANTPAAAAPPAQPGPVTRTKAKVSFKVSSRKPRRNAKVTLSGTVSPVPAKSSRVMIEVRGKKKKWITAAVVRVRAGGKYTWSHRFGTRGGYTMRARLLGTGDALVKPGSSAPRTFRVR